MQVTAAPAKYAYGVLVDVAGMTLHPFDKDTLGKNICVGQCAICWPPLKAGAEDNPGRGYSIIIRDDGFKQRAFEKKPLCLWMKDVNPGDKTGDGVNKSRRVCNIFSLRTPPGPSIVSADIQVSRMVRKRLRHFHTLQMQSITWPPDS